MASICRQCCHEHLGQILFHCMQQGTYNLTCNLGTYNLLDLSCNFWNPPLFFFTLCSSAMMLQWPRWVSGQTSPLLLFQFEPAAIRWQQPIDASRLFPTTNYLCTHWHVSRLFRKQADTVVNPSRQSCRHSFVTLWYLRQTLTLKGYHKCTKAIKMKGKEW